MDYRKVIEAAGEQGLEVREVRSEETARWWYEVDLPDGRYLRLASDRIRLYRGRGPKDWRSRQITAAQAYRLVTGSGR